MSLETAQKVIVLQKKNYVPHFLKQRDINSYYVPATDIMYLTHCCWFLKIPEDCCCLGGIVHILYPCRWWQGSSTGTYYRDIIYVTISLYHYCTRRPWFRVISIATFSLSRKYTFRPRSKPSDMPIRIYNYMYTPPPSLPSTILSSKQGEKWTLRLMIIHPSKRVDQPR